MTQEASANPLPRSVGYTLKQVDAVLRASMERELRPLGLTVPQYACLELLGQYPGLSNADLARGAFVSRQSMNLVLRGLQERGLVERPDTAETGRARPTRLTASGQELLSAASRSIIEVEERMLRHLTASSRDALREELARCAANLAEG